MSNDPEDNQPPAPELGRTFQFRGQKLAPYSFAHEAALIRLSGGHSFNSFEESPYLVYMLLCKTPEQMDCVRSPEEKTAFRIEAGKWAKENGLTVGDGWKEVHVLANSILTPVAEAKNLEPAPVKGAKKSGKA